MMCRVVNAPDVWRMEYRAVNGLNPVASSPVDWRPRGAIPTPAGPARRAQAVGINAVLYFAPTLFARLCYAPFAANALIGAVNVAATVLAMTIVDRRAPEWGGRVINRPPKAPITHRVRPAACPTCGIEDSEV